MKKVINKILILFFITGLSVNFISCLGAGRSITFQENIKHISYDQVFEVALKSAEKMCEECKKINPFNFPVLVSLGTSKSRGIITLHYQFDPEAGSLCTQPPPEVSAMAKRIFVPRFGAEFYMHIKIIRDKDKATGINIQVTQSKGIKKEIFDREMERLKSVYQSYLNKYLSNL